MRSATDPVVERFVNEYSDLLESMAEENGELLGFINPIISRYVFFDKKFLKKLFLIQLNAYQILSRIVEIK